MLIFCRVFSLNGWHLRKIFSNYEKISDQQINKDKSKVHFGPYFRPSVRRSIKRILAFTEGVLPFTYLGVPIFCGVPHRSHLQLLTDKIISKFARWKDNSLYMAGRVYLVELVILSSMVYAMLIYRWPVSLLRAIERSICNFIWIGDVSHKGSVMIKWYRMYAPKMNGGLALHSIPRVFHVSSSIWVGIRQHYSTLLKDSRWLICKQSQVQFWLDN